MSEMGEQKKSNTTPWVIGGLVVVCLCAVAVAGFVLLVGFVPVALFGMNASVAMSTPIAVTAMPAIPAPTALPATNIPPTALPVRQTIDVPDLGHEHVPEGTPVSYNSDPPTSGSSYAIAVKAGFRADTVPDGRVVYNMEHGYVVIWYDCATLADADCKTLQDDIRGLIEASSQTRLIAIPRAGMPRPIALTAWTKLAYLDRFDADFINAFIDENILHGPEKSEP